MIKRFLLLIGLVLAPAAQAHFFAHQEWYNPATGQVLEEYYDLHSGIDAPTHRNALLERLKKNKHALVVVEDRASMSTWNFIKKNPIPGDIKSFVKPLTESILKQEDLDASITDRTPLTCLYDLCFTHDIPAFNAEFRDSKKDENQTVQEKQTLQTIAAYNDGPILNAFYRSLPVIAQQMSVHFHGRIYNKSALSPETLAHYSKYNIDYSALVTPPQDMVDKYAHHLHHCFALDAQILHAIHITKNKHIVVAAGAAHIESINNILLQIGWLPGNVVVGSNLNGHEKAKLSAYCLHPQANSDHAQYMNLRSDKHKTENIRELERKSFIDIGALATNPLLAYAPGCRSANQEPHTDIPKAILPPIAAAIVAQKRGSRARIQRPKNVVKKRPQAKRQQRPVKRAPVKPKARKQAVRKVQAARAIIKRRAPQKQNKKRVQRPAQRRR